MKVAKNKYALTIRSLQLAIIMLVSVVATACSSLRSTLNSENLAIGALCVASISSEKGSSPTELDGKRTPSSNTNHSSCVPDEQFIELAERPEDATQKKVVRNKLIFIMLGNSDKLYSNFTQNVAFDHSLFETVFDIASIGMTAAATLAGGGVATTLAGTDTAWKGTHSALNENWIANNTIPAIVLSIDARRAEIRKNLKERMNEDYSQFQMAEALGYIHEYHSSASLSKGVVYLHDVASKAKNRADEALTKGTPIDPEAKKHISDTPSKAPK